MIKIRKKTYVEKYKKEITAYTLLAIPILWWLIFFLYAFLRSLYFSFTDLRFSTEQISTFNFNNYIRLFHDHIFWGALSNTLIWTSAMTIANNVLGLLVAFMIFKLKKGKKIFLALLFWPTLVSAVTGAQITKTIFNPSETGLMNSIISFFGGKPLGWYNDPKIALISLMIIPLLLGFSLQMMLYYVALNNIPKSYIEATQLETNSQFKILRYVYLPLIKNILSLNIVLSLISNLKILGPMQLIGDGIGGPLNSTNTMMLMLYNVGITGYEMGYASAIGVVATIIIITFALIQQKLTGKGVDYE